ncbi:DUF6243 family protein [Spirillospora sp. NPDC127200]
MAKSRNGLLGVGGQRKKIARRELRGGQAGAGGAGDPLAQKRELLRKMRERNAAAKGGGAQDTDARDANAEDAGAERGADDA